MSTYDDKTCISETVEDDDVSGCDDIDDCKGCEAYNLCYGRLKDE